MKKSTLYGIKNYMVYLSLNYFCNGCNEYCCTIKICHCLMVSKDSADCLHFLKGKVLLLTVFEWEHLCEIHNFKGLYCLNILGV